MTAPASCMPLPATVGSLGVVHVRPVVMASGSGHVQTIVAAAALQHCGSTDITLFTRTGCEPAVAAAAALDAFDYLYARSAGHPRPLPVHINQGDLRRELALLAAAFPSIDLVGSADRRFQRLLNAAGEAIAVRTRDAESTLAQQEAERVRTLPDLVVATDASKNRRRAGVGIACVTEDGRYRQRMCSAVETVLQGERLAIRLAMASFRNVPLRVLTDSQHAVRCLTTLDFAATITSDNRVHGVIDEIKALSAGRRVRFDWVRGHSGHKLNEIADRLAVAARRCHEAGIDHGQSRGLAAQIVADLELGGHTVAA